ncbi:hypothetical protein [Halorubrum halodurans]|uniref:hypothetical protein n=1 Tax=Halorubrum halodurans TaxID=1383851 RepID=UPI00117B92BA|nr:hypothetical protein [Halorubrum halodurans]
MIPVLSASDSSHATLRVDEQLIIDGVRKNSTRHTARYVIRVSRSVVDGVTGVSLQQESTVRETAFDVDRDRWDGAEDVGCVRPVEFLDVDYSEVAFTSPGRVVREAVRRGWLVDEITVGGETFEVSYDDGGR